jgi:hypothetical protein
VLFLIKSEGAESLTSTQSFQAQPDVIFGVHVSPSPGWDSLLSQYAPLNRCHRTVILIVALQ